LNCRHLFRWRFKEGHLFRRTFKEGHLFRRRFWEGHLFRQKFREGYLLDSDLRYFLNYFCQNTTLKLRRTQNKKYNSPSVITILKN
jgi:hypothetical protein